MREDQFDIYIAVSASVIKLYQWSASPFEPTERDTNKPANFYAQSLSDLSAQYSAECTADGSS